MGSRSSDEASALKDSRVDAGRHWIDGQPVAAGDGSAEGAQSTGLGHFTSLQLRGGMAQGIDLHLARLRRDHLAIFATPLSDARLSAALAPVCGHVEAAAADATLRITIVPDAPGADPRIHVALSPPCQVPALAVALASACHVRRDPARKHADIAGQRALLAEVRARGFDDALMVDAAGEVLEGTFWNLLVCREGRLLWPAGPSLHGVTQQLLQQALPQAGLAQRTVALRAEALVPSDALYAMNARGVWAVAAIDGRGFRQDDQGLARLRQLLAGKSPQRLSEVVRGLETGRDARPSSARR